MNKYIIVLLALALTSCSWIPLHKIDIQQGNYVTQEMVDKLKPGMSKPQVRFVLGTPLVNDIFHVNRWDYVYRNEQQGKLIEEGRLTIFFEDEKLKRVEGDVRPKQDNSKS
jgi:outer membrane protein assembly factor BamE